jgi:thiol-disulfide isomerase/thioredoxin
MSGAQKQAVSARAGDPQRHEGRLGYTFAAGLLALTVLAGVALLPRVSLAPAKSAGPAPAFVLPVLHNGEKGSRLSLADLQGQPVLLDFWATWCGPCAAQTPILDRLAKRYEGRGLRVVGINVADDDPSAAMRYAAKKNLSYPIVLDADGSVQREYGVSKLPTLVLVDKRGQVHRVASGLVDEASLDKLIREIL